MACFRLLHDDDDDDDARYSRSVDSGPLSQRSAIANVQGGLDWIQTIVFF